MISHALMIDTIHANVPSIPVDTPFIGGYITGTPDIQWTPTDWARFPGSVHNRIWQGHGSYPDIHTFDTIDIESGALTPASAAATVRKRVAAGIEWTTLYGSDAALTEASALIVRMGRDVWNGHVNCILADWNLHFDTDPSKDTASHLIGTLIHGMTCVGVQWASPASNPDTLLPGTPWTLRQANCDLNVVDASWRPSSVPVTPPAAPLAGVVIGPTVHDVRNVTSQDGGKSWT